MPGKGRPGSRGTGGHSNEQPGGGSTASPQHPLPGVGVDPQLRHSTHCQGWGWTHSCAAAPTAGSCCAAENPNQLHDLTQGRAWPGSGVIGPVEWSLSQGWCDMASRMEPGQGQ